MDPAAALALIAPIVRSPDAAWADLGAGSGTFTRALAALLGPRGRVVAVERDARHAEALRQLAAHPHDGAPILVLHADFTAPLDLASLDVDALDGALLANALHFVPADHQAAVLRVVASWLAPRGRIALVEYEHRGPSRWVPAPVSFARFAALAREIGLAPAVRVGARPSAFGGEMYAAYAEAGDAG